MADWNAGVYHRVSAPQFEWGMRVLERLELDGTERIVDVGCGTGRLTREVASRVSAGRVVGVDRSASMLAQAKTHLVDAGVPLVRAHAAALPFVAAFDVVFSTATFHWVLDHDALFRSLFSVLVSGGRLHAQAGGGPNLACLRGRASQLIQQEPYLTCFETGWSEPWTYADPETTKTRMEHAGFRDVSTWLEPAPIQFDAADEFRAFVEIVCLHPYLNRLPPQLQSAFAEALVSRAAADDPPFVLDYWRLNLIGNKP